MRELKLVGKQTEGIEAISRTLPRVRELKLRASFGTRNISRRTLPRVRELKLNSIDSTNRPSRSRTLPRVRELKHGIQG